MAKTNQSRKIWVLALIGIVALILVGGLVSLQPCGSPLNWLIRGAALMGYMAIFLSAVSSAYMRQVYRTFVWSFVVQPNGSQLITGRLLRRCAPRNDI